jgi:hypothetical protein
MRPAFAVLGVCLLALPLLAACGGGDDDDGDDFDDIRASATAAAERSPTEGATTADAGGDGYPAAAREAVDELNEALAQLNADLTAAEGSQADPKWPGILNADIEAVRTAGAAVKDLEAPADLEDISTAINDGVDEVLRGVDQLANAIESASQEVGAQAVLAITTGTTAVNTAVSQLPAE